MGFFDIFKKSRREVVRENQSRGKEGEEHIKSKYEFNGYKVKRTGRGHDFKAEKRDWLTGRKETKYIEVKTGNSKLSDLQRKKKRQFGRGKYVEERLDHTPFGFISQDDTYKLKSPTKRETKRSSGYDSMFSLSGGSKSRKNNGHDFGSGLDNMFGTGSSRKQSRSNSFSSGRGLNDMFGTGSSGRRKKNSSNSWGF
ncbi:MAG TPA: hypothetical protein VN704_00095 [Verrucomicrobiae bacterium]|nr:hypothetical protein [Verrucomicrobiae bacterium]